MLDPHLSTAIAAVDLPSNAPIPGSASSIVVTDDELTRLRQYFADGDFYLTSAEKIAAIAEDLLAARAENAALRAQLATAPTARLITPDQARQLHESIGAAIDGDRSGLTRATWLADIVVADTTTAAAALESTPTGQCAAILTAIGRREAAVTARDLTAVLATEDFLEQWGMPTHERQSCAEHRSWKDFHDWAAGIDQDYHGAIEALKTALAAASDAVDTARMADIEDELEEHGMPRRDRLTCPEHRTLAAHTHPWLTWGMPEVEGLITAVRYRNDHHYV